MTEHISKIKNITSYFRNLIIEQYQKTHNMNHTIIGRLCDMLEKEPQKLKIYLLKIENLVFNSTTYINRTQSYIWNILKLKWLPVYNRIDPNDYNRLYNFFLLMTHNIPIIPPYSDSCIPGCLSIIESYTSSEIKRKYNESSPEICEALDKINGYKEKNNDIHINSKIFDDIIPVSKYMRVEQWINKDCSNNRFFGCLCENHF